MSPSFALPRGSRRVLAIVSATALAAGALLLRAPAATAQQTETAVQTKTFGLTAAPDAQGAARSSIAHPANGATVREKIQVYNRTDKTITVDLGVVTAKHQGSAYLVGQSGDALSKRIALKVDKVTLKAHEQATIPVTIKTPRGGTENKYAAITASSGTTGSGTVAVAERLALFVDMTPTTKLVPEQRSVAIYVAIGLALLVLLIVAYAVYRYVTRERRDDKRTRPALG